MRYLFFDLETNGLPKSWRGHWSDVDNWPEAVSIAWWVETRPGNWQKSNYELLNRSDIPEEKYSREAETVHGLTYWQLLNEGKDPVLVYGDFLADAVSADLIIAHNIEFDLNVLRADLVRFGLSDSFPSYVPTFCTMRESTNYCKITNTRFGSGYKWPKLEELYFRLFIDELKDAHNALADVRATAKCFFEMKERGIIQV